MTPGPRDGTVDGPAEAEELGEATRGARRRRARLVLLVSRGRGSRIDPPWPELRWTLGWERRRWVCGWRREPCAGIRPGTVGVGIGKILWVNP